MQINEIDVVRLKDGREGTVVGLYEDGNVLMLEICNNKGETLDIIFVNKDEVEEVTYRYEPTKE